MTPAQHYYIDQSKTIHLRVYNGYFLRFDTVCKFQPLRKNILVHSGLTATTSVPEPAACYPARTEHILLRRMRTDLC